MLSYPGTPSKPMPSTHTQSSKQVVWKPMPGKIVVKVLGDTERSASGLLFLPATREIPRTTGEVIAIYEPFTFGTGEDAEYSTPFVKVGDVVIFGRFTGTEITFRDEKVIVLKEQDILTIVEAAPELVDAMEAQA